MHKILVTGAAGFIGFHLTKALLSDGYEVLAIDNLQDDDIKHLKYERLQQLGFAAKDIKENQIIQSGLCKFVKADISDRQSIDAILGNNACGILIHLAAQTGVRLSVTQPDFYIKNNILGFYHMLEACRKYRIKKVLFASSSSVYGENPHMPYKEEYNTDNPESLYAVTKKTNEIMAKTYSKLYGFDCIGLRFFTVYGPWVRSDMAAFIFMQSIFNDKTINLYNNGCSLRDFTYIDDVVQSILLIAGKLLNHSHELNPYYELYNVGNSAPVTLIDFLNCIKKNIGKNTDIINKPLQEGDVTATYANADKLFNFIGFKPQTNIEDGVKKMVDWFLKMQNDDV